MTVSTREELQAMADLIGGETAKRANTPQRVGDCLRGIADSMQMRGEDGQNGLDVTAFGAVAGGAAAANVVALTAAVAAAAAQSADLYWPAGEFDTDATIPLLHTVRHRGPGAITRGSDTFYPDPKVNQSNAFYVSTVGSADNDGLSSAQPTTLDAIRNYLYNYGPVLQGTWTVWLAAGTYNRTAQFTLEGLRSLNYIRFRGPEVGGSPNVPTAILDGTASTGGVCALYFRANMRVDVRNIKVQNFASSDAHGIIIDRFTEGVFTNVHTAGCEQAGLHADSACRLYVVGGIYALNIFYNIRVYAGGVCSIGSSGVTGRVTVGDTVHAGGAGIHVRDHSSGHVDYTDFVNVTGSGGALQITNQSRVHLVDVVFSGCYYNTRCDESSTYIDSSVTRGAATARDAVCWGFSIPTADNQKVLYDPTTGFFKFGRTDILAPKCLVDVADPATAQWGGGFNTNVLLGVTGATNAYLGLGAGNAGSCGIHFADVAGNRQGVLEYLHSSDSFLMRANAIDAFRWFSDTSANGYFRSEVTGANAASLGDATHGWRELWLGTVSLSFGTGVPAAVKPNGSLFLRTDGTGPNLYVRENGAWVAK